MTSLVMAAFGSMAGAGVVAALASARGVRLFPRLGDQISRQIVRSERFAAWLTLAVACSLILWAWTGWPVLGLWSFAGVLSVPLLRRSGPSSVDEIARVEAIATWTEQVRDTMSASAGLQQALVATARRGPPPIDGELAAFARRAPRGDLGGALDQLGRDIAHPAADMVIVGLRSAADLDAGRLVPLLSRLAASIRDDAQMRVRVEVGRARVRTSMKIVGVCVALTALLLLVAGGELLRGYSSMTGQIWLLVVGVVVVLAVWSSRKLAEVPQPERFVSRVRMGAT